MQRLLTLTCCTLLLSGCALIDDNNDRFIRQTFLFEIEHRNYAWGHAWYGLYVDNEGTVYTYILDASTRWEPASPDAFTPSARPEACVQKRRVKTVRSFG